MYRKAEALAAQIDPKCPKCGSKNVGRTRIRLNTDASVAVTYSCNVCFAAFRVVDLSQHA